MGTTLPPLSWLREREWGRDVTAYARGQYERVRDHETILRHSHGGASPISLMVHFGLMRERGIRALTIDVDQARSTAQVSGHETETAKLMAEFVSAGMRYHSLGPDLVKRTMDGPKPAIGSVLGPDACFYVRCEGLDLTGPDGTPIDGFLIDRYDAADDLDDGTLVFLPMSTQLPDLDRPINPVPPIWIDLADSEQTLEDALRDAAAGIRTRAAEHRNPTEQTADETGRDAGGDVATGPFMDDLWVKSASANYEEVVHEAWSGLRGDLADAMERQAGWIEDNADVCARLLGMAVACLDGWGPEGHPAYPDDAPSDEVAKAFASGTGSKKAAQRLAAKGYPRITRHEVGLARTEPQKFEKPAAPRREPRADDGEPAPAPRPSRGIDRRKEKRRSRQVVSDSPVANPASDRITQPESPAAPSTAAPGAKTAIDKTPIRTPVADERSASAHLTDADANGDVQLGTREDLRETIDGVIQRTLKDLPALGARNWESSFPSALAAMLMRRTRVARNPRETDDGTRRRLAADILPRLQGLPQHLAHLRTEERDNPGHRRFARISAPHVLRDVDRYVADQAIHPITVVVSGDERLEALLRFPGTSPSDTVFGERIAMVRAWREDCILHLDGILFEGCLAGFRRLDHDLSDGTTTVHDGEADAEDPRDVLDALYAPLADAVLGPVDEADAWMYERRTRNDRARPATGRTRSEGADPRSAEPIAPAPVAPDEEIGAGGLTQKPTDDDFSDWACVSAPWTLPPLDAGRAGAAREKFSSSSIASAILDAIAAHAHERETDPEVAAVLQAAGRHASSFATADAPRIVSLNRPEIGDDVDLTRLDDADGVLIVNDPAAAEQVGTGLIRGRRITRERAVAIMYRLRREGLTALLLQITAEARIAYAQWISTPLASTAEVDDASWYVRGAVHEALAPSLHLTGDAGEDEPAADTLRALPRQPGAGDPRRQGPRRIVAQARLRPARMSDAVAVIRRWFDEQAARHGDTLVEDRRDEGEWNHEHVSLPKGGVTSNWAVTVRMPDDQPGAIDIVVRTTLATGVRPRLPTIVREIALATPTDGPDGRLQTEPPVVRTRSDLLDLIRHLQSEDRVLPTLVMTADRNGDFIMSPTDVALQSLGAMNVRVLDEAMTYDLADKLGQEYRTFGGAVRLFQPRFNPDVDPASRHPRIMRDVAAGRAINEMIARVTAATVTRYDIPDAVTAATAVPTPELPRAADALAAHAKAADRPHTSVAPGTAEAELPLLVPDSTGRAPEGGAEEENEASGNTVETPAPAETAPEDGDGRTTPDDASKTFIPDEDEPTRRDEPVRAKEEASPTADAETLADLIEEGVARALDRMGLASAMRRMADVADGVERLGATIERRLDGLHQPGQADARVAELQDELRAERETMTELLEEAAGERDAALAEAARLRHALNQRRRAESAKTPEWPKDLSGLSEWLDRNVLPNVVVTSKAWRAMRHVRYTDMERLCRTLQLLDGAYVDMRAGEEGAKQRWDEGLKELRLENKKQGDMGKGIRGGHEYSFTHEGQIWGMDFHIRGTESLYNQTDRLLRIYFAFDKEQGRVLIGHMPTHLTTVDS